MVIESTSTLDSSGTIRRRWQRRPGSPRLRGTASCLTIDNSAVGSKAGFRINKKSRRKIDWNCKKSNMEVPSCNKRECEALNHEMFRFPGAGVDNERNDCDTSSPANGYMDSTYYVM